MAQVEPMDVENDSEDKENSIQISNVLSRAACTEKGYEELDVSEMSMKLRYSITPCTSPMCKSYSGNCRDSKLYDIGEDLKNDSLITGNIHLTQSLNSTFTSVDNKVNKLTPLQPLATDTMGDVNRTPLRRRSLESNPLDPNVTITLNDNDHLENISLPSTSSSATHTPEATTPTKDIPKDGGSPIMRGLKSVFSMFRSSQSPIPPPPEQIVQSNVLADSSPMEQSKSYALVSTPVNVFKNKESSPKRNSPLKDSVVFKDDLEKELLWKNEETIIFKGEKIPRNKLLLQQSYANNLDVKQIECAENHPNNRSVEYMDISHSESIICDKTMSDVQLKLAVNVTETIGNVESDSEFVDCETTFTKEELNATQNFEIQNQDSSQSINPVKYCEDLESPNIVSTSTDTCLNFDNISETTESKANITEEIENNEGSEQKLKTNITQDIIENKVNIEKQIIFNQETEEELKFNQGTGGNNSVYNLGINSIEGTIHQERSSETTSKEELNASQNFEIQNQYSSQLTDPVKYCEDLESPNVVSTDADSCFNFDTIAETTESKTNITKEIENNEGSEKTLNVVTQGIIENKVNVEKQIIFSQKTEEELKFNQGTGNDKSVYNINSIEDTIHQEKRSDNNGEAVKKAAPNSEYLKNAAPTCQLSSSNSKNDTCKLDDCHLENQLLANKVISLSLSNNFNTSNHSDPIEENKQTDMLLNNNNLNVTYETSLLQRMPDEINETINLSLTDNEPIADLNVLEENKNISLSTDLEQVKLDGLIHKFQDNLNTVVPLTVLNEMLSDQNLLQNEASYSCADDIIRDVSKCDEKSKEINENVHLRNEEKCNLFTNKFTDTSYCNETYVEASSIVSYSNNEHVFLPTYVPLPSANEAHQDVITCKDITEKVIDDTLKICMHDKELNLLDVNKTVPLNLDLSLKPEKCTIGEREINYIPEKLFDENKSLLHNSLQFSNTAIDITKENCESNKSTTQISSETDSVTVSENNAVNAYEQASVHKEAVVDQDNSEYQIISSNIISESDLKLEDDEIITSAGNSPYVSVTEIGVLESDNRYEEEDNLYVKNKELVSPPISPKEIKKGYDINFDEIDDPFATKTKIRVSPTPDTSIKNLAPIENPLKKKNSDKKRDTFKSKQKQQNEKKSKKNLKSLNTKVGCILKDDKIENVKDDKAESEIFHCSKMEKSVENLFNTTFDCTVTKQLNNQTFEIDLLSGKNCNNRIDDHPDTHIRDDDNNLDTNGNLNEAIACHTKTSNSLDVDLQKDDSKNIRIDCQDDKNLTIDLLKDIKGLTIDEQTFVEKTQEDQLNSSKVITCDISADIKEYGNNDLEDKRTAIAEENYIHSLTACSISQANVEKDHTSLEIGKDSIVGDLDVDNNHTLNRLDHSFTVLDAQAQETYSMTEVEVDHTMSDTKNYSVMSNSENKFILSSENGFKTEIKNNCESDLPIDKKPFSNNISCSEFEKKTINTLDHFVNNEDNRNNELFEVKQSRSIANPEILANNKKLNKPIAAEKKSYLAEIQEVEKLSPSNISVATCSSKSADDDTTIKEILTEDEDTIEGPFLESEEYSEPINKQVSDTVDDNVMEFDFPPPLTTIDSVDNDELFIDAEAFEFLLNQNKSNVIADSGKESLFLKFDPLFAKRLSSDGIFAAMSKIHKRQSTPNKIVKPSRAGNIQTESPQPGPSNQETLSNELLDHIDVASVAKPMMVVNPAVNPVTTPRKATPKMNRRSLTFTSPAMAVIDRLLSLNENNSLMEQNTSLPPVVRNYSETDIALTQLRELLAEKEIHVHNLRCESKDLKDRLASLESQMKNLETESGDRLKKINILNERLTEKSKINKSMALVVEEYERTIASLISDIEQDKKRNAEEKMRLVKERDEQTAHLASMEVSFSDLHSKYEKSKQIILSMKANEDKYKNSLKEFEDSLIKMQSNYEFLKQHATSKLNHANQELEKINKAHESEVLKLNALIKRKELHITSLEETLMQKTKANEELTAICDELINKVG